MHRIDGDGNDAGMFTEGSPPLTPATVVTADWMNAVQEEIIAVLTAAGITPSKPSNVQLLAALAVLYGRLANANTWTSAQTMQSTLSVSSDLTVDTNTLKVDATNNRVGIGTASPNAALSIGHDGVVSANVPLQINAGSSADIYFGANKGGALGLLVGYSNGGALGTKGAIRNYQNEPIGIYLNSTTQIAEVMSSGLSIKAADPTYPFTGLSNTLTTLNIPKAWGYIEAGNNTISNAELFNATCAVIPAKDVAVSLPLPMATGSNYAVTAAVYGLAIGDRAIVEIVDNTAFKIRVVNNSGTQIDLTSGAVVRAISFMVFGRQ